MSANTRLGIATLVGAAALLAGCAQSPDQIEVLVETTPPGASCVLERQGQPLADIAPTPAIALVDANNTEITVRCRRSGFADGLAVLHPQPEAPVFGPILAAPPGPYEQRVDIALIPR